MMVNKVILIGNLGQDPERKDVSGHVLAKFSLATSKKIKDKQVTQWHDCQMWDKMAEALLKYVKKGDALYIEGEIVYNKKDDRQYTNIVCTTMRMLGGRPQTKKSEDDDFPF